MTSSEPSISFPAEASGSEVITAFPMLSTPRTSEKSAAQNLTSLPQSPLFTVPRPRERMLSAGDTGACSIPLSAAATRPAAKAVSDTESAASTIIPDFFIEKYLPSDLRMRRFRCPGLSAVKNSIIVCKNRLFMFFRRCII